LTPPRSKQEKKTFQKKKKVNSAATKRWNLQLLHHKTNLFLHEENNIIQQMAKNLRFFIAVIFYDRAVGKKDHYLTHLLSYASTVL
jgi:hypothetical protein